MSVDKFIVTITGFIGIIITYWFFLMKKEKVISVKNATDIIVEGGYNPDVISIPKNQTTTINFVRKDPSSCLEEVVIPNFKIRKYLPLNKKISISITPKETGEFGFACGMNMFHGKIIVKDSYEKS